MKIKNLLQQIDNCNVKFRMDAYKDAVKLKKPLGGEGPLFMAMLFLMCTLSQMRVQEFKVLYLQKSMILSLYIPTTKLNKK